MGNFNRKLRKCKKGVSDIIGNILILGITVTLFSSIMYFVVSMPQPQEGAYADFTPDVTYLGDPVTSIELNLTHKGGQELKAYNTNIYLDVNDTRIVLHMADSLNPLGDLWTVGETFIYRYAVGSENPYMLRLSVMISDTEKNTLLFNANIVGGTTQTSSAPIIGARGTNPSPTFAGSTFSFYAQVMDVDKDLNVNSVWVNLSSIGYPVSRQMYDNNSDGIFACGPFTAIQAWNGAIVIVNASDWTGHGASGRITMSILTQQGGGGSQSQYGPYYNYSSYMVNGTFPPDVSGGESGGLGGAGTTFYYIRKLDNYGVITNSFNGGERVLIELYSDKLSNLAIENSFYLSDSSSGSPLVPPTKVMDAFQYGGIYGTFHRYVTNFSAPNSANIYPIQIKCKDNFGTVINIADSIFVNGASYPIVETYALNETTNTLKKTAYFNHTDTLYLKIRMIDVDSSVLSIGLGDFEVSDFTGRYIVKKLAPAATSYPASPTYSAPISSLFKTSGSGLSASRVPDTDLSGVYTIKIVLKDAYQGWWLPRTNSYTVKLASISDMGVPGFSETYYTLSSQFYVTAPLSTTDVIASIGSGSFTWSSSGAAWDDNALAWFKGGERSDQWTKVVIDPDTYNGPTAMSMADIDGDGYKDLVVGWQDATVAAGWYRNEEVSGTKWSIVPYLIAPTFDAYPGTDAAGDAARDAANEDVSVFSTFYDEFYPGGSSYVSTNELAGAMALGDFDKDGDQDVVISMVHAVVYTSAISSGAASYSNSYGMYFNRGIYVYWNDGSWGSGTKYALEGTLLWTAGTGDYGANGNYNPAAMDMQCADLDGDGYDDIVSAYQSGETKVWMNKWSSLSGNTTYKHSMAFGSQSLLNNVPDVPGRGPWDNPQEQSGRVARARLADIDRNGYPDIVRTSTTNNNVYVIYTEAITGSNNQHPNAESGTATVTGSFADLTLIDNRYENLTERLTAQAVTGLPNKGATDNTGQVINNIRAEDGVYYRVNEAGTGQNLMYLNPFSIDSAYDGNGWTVTSSRIRLTYYVGSASYVTGNYVQYSSDGGGTWLNLVQPLAGQTTPQVVNFNLLAAGVDTYSELANLRVRFTNAASGSGDRSVYFDVLVEEITFTRRAMEWTWNIDNDATRPFHNLLVTGMCLTPGESFDLSYSTNGANWITLASISSTTQDNYSFALPYHEGPLYYIKVVDNVRSAGDVSNNTLCINMVAVEHLHASVYWPVARMRTVSIPGLAVGEFLTSLAVGDIGKSWGDYKYDNYPDLVVCTSKVGNGDSTHTLFVVLQQTGGSTFESPVSVDTSLVAGNVGSNNAVWDARDVELGDFNGDKNLDIVLVLGFAPGRTGSGVPSLYTYMNRPDLGPGVFSESTINVLDTSESAINVETANIDLAILLPFLGIVGVIVAEAVIDRRRKR